MNLLTWLFSKESELPEDGNKPKDSNHQMYRKACVHDGMKPVLIGGYKVYLAANRHIDYKILDSAHYILPLNSQAPHDLMFGRTYHIIGSGLKDYGGVPPNWKDFIYDMAKLVRKRKKLLAYCTGSHGRTGTFAASLIAVMEPNIEDPIAAIRKRHCSHAVETIEQATAVFDLKDKALPKRYKEEFYRPPFVHNMQPSQSKHQTKTSSQEKFPAFGHWSDKHGGWVS